MTRELENNHHTDLTPNQIRLLKRQRRLHPVWNYEGGEKSTFVLDGETFLDLIQGNPLRIDYDEPDKDLEELKSLMESEPNY